MMWKCQLHFSAHGRDCSCNNKKEVDLCIPQDWQDFLLSRTYISPPTTTTPSSLLAISWVVAEFFNISLTAKEFFSCSIMCVCVKLVCHI
jgi:hypothetical protein